jgi:glycosyltransferase involved in cell wall biosynthesis
MTDFKREIGYYYLFPKSKNYLFEGGKRLLDRGAEPQETNPPLVSIITVVYNAEKLIQTCIDSVFRQEYPNIEYIIIDGASTDNTLRIIKSNIHNIDYVLSEADEGIYNAMNKGLSLAQGEYISLINADDSLTANGIRESIFNIRSANADLSLGNVNVLNPNHSFSHIWKPGKFDHQILLGGMNCCHQGIVASKKCYLEAGLFDERYDLSSDYKWLKEVYIKDLKPTFTSIPVANFLFDGASANNRKQWKKECKEMALDLFPNSDKIAMNDFLEFVYKDGVLKDNCELLIQANKNNNDFLQSYALILQRNLLSPHTKKISLVKKVLKKISRVLSNA